MRLVTGLEWLQDWLWVLWHLQGLLQELEQPQGLLQKLERLQGSAIVYLPQGECFSSSCWDTRNNHRTSSRNNCRAHCEGWNDSRVCHHAQRSHRTCCRNWSCCRVYHKSWRICIVIRSWNSLFPLRMLNGAEQSSVGIGQAPACWGGWAAWVHAFLYIFTLKPRKRELLTF